jgi:hypothetical protein
MGLEPHNCDIMAESAADKPMATEPVATMLTESLSSPFMIFAGKLDAILVEAEYSEMWGIQLSEGSDLRTSLVLHKFLNGNERDPEKAASQLLEALKWRKKMQPLKLVEETFDPKKFGGLGYVTAYEAGPIKEVVTWNIYGGVKDITATFGDVDECV